MSKHFYGDLEGRSVRRCLTVSFEFFIKSIKQVQFVLVNQLHFYPVGLLTKIVITRFLSSLQLICTIKMLYEHFILTPYVAFIKSTIINIWFIHWFIHLSV